MAAPAEEPMVRLTFRLAWHAPEPLAVLVRQVLKVALRRWGLRCVKCEWLPPREGDSSEGAE